MQKCQDCTNIKNNHQDFSLINIFKNNFYKDIPSIWTDWFNRIDSKIMIIGQDWGPYKEMQELRNTYIKDKTLKNWNKIIDSEKSLTKKMLYKFLIESSKNTNLTIDEEFINHIYITNAIMCARQGLNYRSNNIKLQKCTLNCQKFLKSQIDIIKPKIILTLGYYPLLALSNIYNFPIYKKISENINNYGLFKTNDLVIIPLYHPAAQINSNKQLEQYRKIWDYYEK